MTITGMKQAGAFDYLLAKAALPVEDQLLFLVADVNDKFNPNAVMLHDGVRKLGNVAQGQAPGIRRLIDELSGQMGRDYVIVVSLHLTVDPKTFEYSSTINVTGIAMVYERLARKYAQEADIGRLREKFLGGRNKFN